jgi:hypothetical protein
MENLIERMAEATQTILEGFKAMSAEERADYLDRLFDALAGEETPPARLSTDDPETRRRAYHLLRRLWPNMHDATLPEFVDAFAAVLKIGAEAQAGGRKLTADLAARIVAGFEAEREQRGFLSYREMAETAVSVHQANMRDRENDRRMLN